MEREAPELNEADQPALKKQKLDHASSEQPNNNTSNPVPSSMRNLDEKNSQPKVDDDQLNFLQDKQYFDSYAHLVKKKSKNFLQIKGIFNLSQITSIVRKIFILMPLLTWFSLFTRIWYEMRSEPTHTELQLWWMDLISKTKLF